MIAAIPSIHAWSDGCFVVSRLQFPLLVRCCYPEKKTHMGVSLSLLRSFSSTTNTLHFLPSETLNPCDVRKEAGREGSGVQGEP